MEPDNVEKSLIVGKFMVSCRIYCHIAESYSFTYMMRTKFTIISIYQHLFVEAVSLLTKKVIIRGRTNLKTSLSSPGIRDLHRYSCPQEHHSVQPVREAGSEQRSSTMGRCLHRSVRHDVTHRHRHRHQCDGGSARSWSTNPGRPGGARRRDICLHHLPGDPPTWAQLSREAASQSALHPAGLHHHDSSDIFGLRSVRTLVPPTAAPTDVWMTSVQKTNCLR